MNDKYICPMHPEVISDKPEKCRHCGMNLVPAKGKTIKIKRKSEVKSNQHQGHHKHEFHDHSDHHRMMAEDFKRRFFVVLPLTIVVLSLSPQIQQWFGYSLEFAGRKLILFIVGSTIAFYGGKPFFEAAKDELKSRNWGMMTLVSLAITAGYFFSLAATFLFRGESLWWEISTLVLVFLFGHWVEMRAVLGTGGTLKELAKLIPPKTHKLVGGVVKNIKTEDLKKGDLVLIKPGEKLPADGIVTKGGSSVNESMITGESKPINKKKGDEVIGGTINNDGSLTVKVTKIGSESALNQIVDLIHLAQETKPSVQKLADKAANWLTIIAIVVGSATFIYWMFVNPIGVVAAVTFAITVIVITCPHALGLAIPTVTTITTSIAAKNGILIRDMKGLEIAQKLDYIVFDKTGTLTMGQFGVSNVIPLNNLKEIDILKIAAAVEIHSEHSIARGIVEEMKKRGISFKKASNFKAVAGKGVKATLQKSNVILGNIEMLKKEKVYVDPEQRVTDVGTIVYVAKDNTLLGSIILDDEVRAESKRTIDTLHDMDIKVAMLTGDKKEVANKVGKTLGLDRVFAEVLPEDKVGKIRQLQDKGFTVAMVGDGINDAPSLTQAHLGVAIGAGTSVAIESAEIVLVKDNPLDMVNVINLSKKTGVKMKQNLAWATGYNALAIPAAAGVFSSFGLILEPQWGALLMSASSVIVVANALLLKRIEL
jgi:Cu2+-exporting ATPase